MDVDWVWELFRKVPRPTHLDVSISARAPSSHDFGIRQINDHVYEVSSPIGRRPSVELVFFHGLQLEDSQVPHVDTWLCRDASEFWLNWIPNAIADARILTVSYDAHAKRTDDQGRGGMYVTTENLLQDLIGASPAGAEVGQDRCPVVLVGHCLGGVVMKQLCVYADSKLNLVPQRLKDSMQNFLDNTKGFFFYASPHQGTRLADLETSSGTGPLFAGLTTLNTEAARQNENFRMLCQNHGWRTFAIGESNAITQGEFKGLFVEEASARYNVDEFYTVFANHINVCRPESKLSSNFTKLLTFVSGVVKEVRMFVHLCEVPHYAVDLERSAWDVQRKMVGGAILGIFGMGGIGKTTLAKKLFNNISKDFDYTCFLEGVKDIKIRKLKQNCLREFHFRGKKLGIPPAEFSELRDMKTLIVVDDIDSQEQLDVLPKLQHFQEGSCLILTSRDEKFSNSHHNCIIHRVDFLNTVEAKKLFRFHAFGSKPIPDILAEHVDEVVGKCAGLPLTLEVVGRHLRYRGSDDVEIWKETLDKLTRAEALEGKNDKVWASLKVSYDSLSQEEQAMFVEAATVFHQELTQVAVAAWSAYMKHPRSTWQSLVNRSMVRAVPNRLAFDFASTAVLVGTVWVHEQLRDMAKKIEDFDEYDMLSGSNENAKLIVDSLNTNKVKAKTKKVELSHSMDVGLRLDSLRNLEGLKTLELNDVLCEGSQMDSTPNLSILRCIALSRLPQWWEKLCCLETLSRERLSTFNFNLSRMDKLAVLDMISCVVPEGFPEALGNLTNLRVLSLLDLEGLDHLPRNFGNLSRLNLLQIGSLQSLTLPEEFGSLVELVALKLSDIRSLGLPKSLGELRSLEYLTLENLAELAGLPESFGSHLQKLSFFVIERCPLIKRLPGSFCELSKLEQLFIHDCDSLDELGEGFGKLPSLRLLVLIGVAVKRLPANFGRLSALKELTLNSDSLSSLSDDFVQLPALKRLVISSHELETLPNNFRFLKSLEAMAVVDCSKLERLPEDLGHVGSLREIRLHNCEALRYLPNSWRKPSVPPLELPQRHDSPGVSGEYSQTRTTEEMRLIIYRCPLLDDSVLGSLTGVHVTVAGGSGKNELSEEKALASLPFPRDEMLSFTGYYRQYICEYTMSMQLCFASDQGISGGGIDEVGRFTCTGEWRGSQIHFVKQYIGQHSLLYNGEVNSDTIRGAWTIERGDYVETGGFYLKWQIRPNAKVASNR